VWEACLQEIEITIGRLLRVAWLLAWRGFVGGAVLGGIAGFVIGFVMGVIGFPHEQIASIARIAGFVAGLIWFVLVCKIALQKQYQEFRIALIAHQVRSA
jgi:membrane associated rhomboid family serine protease